MRDPIRNTESLLSVRKNWISHAGSFYEYAYAVKELIAICGPAALYVRLWVASAAGGEMDDSKAAVGRRFVLFFSFFLSPPRIWL